MREKVEFALPRPENLLRELEDDILEDIYTDIDRINSKIKCTQISEVGGVRIGTEPVVLPENPEVASSKTILK